MYVPPLPSGSGISAAAVLVLTICDFTQSERLISEPVRLPNWSMMFLLRPRLFWMRETSKKAEKVEMAEMATAELKC